MGTDLYDPGPLRGALFAAFPKFYATSFGGAYWVWILILFTFVIQAVSYEYRKKPGNFLGEKVYEIFLFINGSVGILLIGAAVGTFFTGSNFTLNEYNLVTWTNPLRGLEAAFSLFNLCLGLFLVFNARILGAMYLINNIDFSGYEALEQRTRRAVLVNLLCALPFLLYVLGSLLLMDGFGFDPKTGVVSMVGGKYLSNLLAMPLVLDLPAFGACPRYMGCDHHGFARKKKRYLVRRPRDGFGGSYGLLHRGIQPYCFLSFKGGSPIQSDHL